MKKTTPKSIARRKKHLLAVQKSALMRKMRRKERQALVALRRLQHMQMLRGRGMITNSDLNRRPVFLPKILSFWENYEETVKCFDEIREHGMRRKTPLSIRFDDVEVLDPSATLALVAEIFRCRKLRIYRNGQFVTGNYSKSASVNFHLNQMGFFKLLQIVEPDCGPDDSFRNGQVYLKFITFNQVYAEITDQFVRVIEDHIMALNAVARGRLVGALKEAMGNVTEHAYSKSSDCQVMPRRWFMSSRVDVEKSEVMVMIYDQGVGIPGTLQPHTLEKLKSIVLGFGSGPGVVGDGLAIKLATEVWRTGTGQAGRGRGFRDMKKFVDECAEGELRVLSNRGFYTYNHTDENYGEHTSSTGGTIIEWRFSSQKPLEMSDD